MKHPIATLLAITSSLTLAGLGRSAAADPAASTAVLVETDPSTFVLHGMSAHVRVEPAAAPGWTFGAGVYALDMPSLFVDADAADRGKDWDVRIRYAYGLFVDRFFDPRGRGALIGVQVALQHLGAARPGEDEARFVDAVVLPRIGYQWFPFRSGFYLLGWFGVGVTAAIAGDHRDYDVLPIIAFGAVHAGWRF